MLPCSTMQGPELCHPIIDDIKDGLHIKWWLVVVTSTGSDYICSTSAVSSLCVHCILRLFQIFMDGHALCDMTEYGSAVYRK